ncbi:MAG: hypothetical protein ACK4MD_11535, partial [Demequina sp.]
MNTALGMAALGTLGVVAAIDLVWMGLALGALLRKFGGNSVHAWIPVLRWVAAAREGRVPTAPVAAARSIEFAAALVAVTALVMILVSGTVPAGVRVALIAGITVWLMGALVGWVMWIYGAGTIELRLRAPRAMTWIAAIAPAIWASVLGWGSYQATGHGVTANAAAAGAALRERPAGASEAEEASPVPRGSESSAAESKVPESKVPASAPGDDGARSAETAPPTDAVAGPARDTAKAPVAPPPAKQQPPWVTGDGGVTVAQRWAGFGADAGDSAGGPHGFAAKAPGPADERDVASAAASRDRSIADGSPGGSPNGPEVTGDDWPVVDRVGLQPGNRTAADAAVPSAAVPSAAVPSPADHSNAAPSPRASSPAPRTPAPHDPALPSPATTSAGVPAPPAPPAPPTPTPATTKAAAPEPVPPHSPAPTAESASPASPSPEAASPVEPASAVSP